MATTLQLKELTYNDQVILVEAARKALAAKADAEGNIISTTYATKAEIGALKSISFELVDALPTTGQKDNAIYLLPSAHTTTQNIKDEFIWIASTKSWEQIGSTSIDLSNYYTKTDADKTFVVKVDGKGLSTNDFTTAEKNKLANITAGASKVEASTTNGNIKINDQETTVYTSLVSSSDVNIEW